MTVGLVGAGGFRGAKSKVNIIPRKGKGCGAGLGSGCGLFAQYLPRMRFGAGGSLDLDYHAHNGVE